MALVINIECWILVGGVVSWPPKISNSDHFMRGDCWLKTTHKSWRPT